jgi:hypothetical protein
VKESSINELHESQHVCQDQTEFMSFKSSNLTDENIESNISKQSSHENNCDHVLTVINQIRVYML